MRAISIMPLASACIPHTLALLSIRQLTIGGTLKLDIEDAPAIQDYLLAIPVSD